MFDFEFIPVVGHAYTFSLTQSAIQITTFTMGQFDLTIEEVPQITDGFYYRDSGSPSGLTIQNLSSGSALMGLRNSTASWRIIQNGTALEFQ